MKLYQSKLLEKLKESLEAVLPIIGIVLLLSFTIAPIPAGILMAFLVGAILLVVGMMFFTLGAEIAMTPMGERIGTRISGSRRLPFIVLLCFTLGFIITVSEPDLQVLAEQVPSIPNNVLIFAVAAGVGIFLVVAVLRMLFGIALYRLLFLFYPVIFILAFFVPADSLAVAFDSGGVTTGPMTVPFIMALGVGFSAVRSDKYAETDSFGLVALCSIGPVLAVLLLGILYRPESGVYVGIHIPDVKDSIELGRLFTAELPLYIREMLLSLLPIVVFFLVFQVLALHLMKRTLVKIAIGILYTYIGLVLFLTGANVGFLPTGNYLGQVLAGLPSRLFHRKGGTGSLCAHGAGRRADFGCDTWEGNGTEFVLRRCGLTGACNDPCTDRNFYFLVSHTGLCSFFASCVPGTENLHCDSI